MKKNLLLALIIFVLNSAIAVGQPWPFGFAKPNCAYINGAQPLNPRCTKWPIISGGSWNAGSTWNNGTLPAHNDIVCIPFGITVQMTGQIYQDGGMACPVSNTANTPTLHIFICGILNFDNSPKGKLYLGCNSSLVIYTGGQIISSGGNADLINISPAGDVWRTNNTTVTGPYTITGNGQGPGVLPVTLINFTAQLKHPYEATINWATASETNSFEFDVERSTDNKNWTSLSTVKAKGNSSSVINYSYIDKKVATGINYYRLKQIDANGSFVYSSIARIINRNAGKIVVYPNPVSSTATLYSSEAWSKNQSLQIVDVNGALVQSESITGGNTIQFSTSKLSAGLYLVRVIENGKTVSQTKLIKQ